MIHRAAPRAFVVGAILFAFASAGHAATNDPAGTKTTVRSASHTGYGRVVIDTTATHPYELDRIGDHVVVRFDPDVVLTGTPAPPKNVVSIEIHDSIVDVTFRPGSEVRSARVGGLVALDIMDPPQSAQRKSEPLPGPPLSMAASPELGGRSAPRLPESRAASPPAAS